MRKVTNKLRSGLLVLLVLLLALFPIGCSTNTKANLTNKDSSQETRLDNTKTDTSGDKNLGLSVKEDGIYDSKEEVALYIHEYNHLPSNYISKEEAKKLGWNGGSLKDYAANKCIGGSRFGNIEGLLPDKKGRTYKECDIDTLNAKSRGAKRIVYSNDGLIYYTDDHYETFTLLYGEE